MKLRELCEKIEYTCLQGSMDVEIADIIYDSRKLEQGTAFVCMIGAKTDGHKYIPDAVAKKASAIVVEKEVDLAEGPGRDHGDLRGIGKKSACLHVSGVFRLSGKRTDNDRTDRNQGKDDNDLYDQKRTGTRGKKSRPDRNDRFPCGR